MWCLQPDYKVAVLLVSRGLIIYLYNILSMKNNDNEIIISTALIQLKRH